MPGINNKILSALMSEMSLWRNRKVIGPFKDQQTNNEHRLRGSPNLTVHFPQNITDVLIKLLSSLI
jgi:hypothetical protein